MNMGKSDAHEPSRSAGTRCDELIQATGTSVCSLERTVRLQVMNFECRQVLKVMNEIKLQLASHGASP